MPNAGDSICVLAVDIYREALRDAVDEVGRSVRASVANCLRQVAAEENVERRKTELTRCLRERAQAQVRRLERRS